jgi:hypothetical protein
VSIALFSLIGIVLFMVHEFDEIILVRAWLKSQRGNKTPRDMWSRARKSYPSTAVMALMVAEEFVLIGGLLLMCVALAWPELALGLLLAHGLHLLGHVADAAKVKRWTPGALTAVATLPLVAVLIWTFAVTNSLQPIWMLAGTLLAGAILLPNLLLLHRLAPRLQSFIDRVYK